MPRQGTRTLVCAFALVLIAGLYGCQNHATDAANAPAAAQRPAFDRAAMDELLQGAIARGETLGASALVYDEGQIVYRGAFGQADRERGVAMDEDTVVRIYSMTKPITSVVIMQMVEEGKINLDDPVTTYVPELANMKVATPEGMRPPARPMTVRDLLTHTSGIAYGIFGEVNPIEPLYDQSGLLSPETDLTTKMEILGQLPLVADPGQIWYYGFNTDVLGLIAERVDEDFLPAIFERRIFAPLGMTETGFVVREDQKPRFASNYALTEDGLVLFEDGQTSDFNRNVKFKSGGSGLVSTLGDYARFAEAMLAGGAYKGGRLLSEETVAAMQSDQLGPDVVYAFPWDENGAVSFGFGGKVVVKADESLTCQKGLAKGMWGWSGAARTLYFQDKDAGSFAILFMQQFQMDDPALHTAFRREVWRQTRNSYQDWCASGDNSASSN